MSATDTYRELEPVPPDFCIECFLLDVRQPVESKMNHEDLEDPQENTL